MSKYDFSRRLKRIVHEECKISKTESRIAQRSIKYYEQISFLKTMLVNQEQELVKYRKEMNKLLHENDKLEIFKQQMESSLCTLISKIDEMKQLHIEQRHMALLQMDCLRTIKLATQTYPNFNALPQLVKGVTVIENDSSSEWKPFCIDPLKHTEKEVSSMIWEDSQIESALKTTWEALIFGEMLDNASTAVAVETEGVV